MTRSTLKCALLACSCMLGLAATPAKADSTTFAQFAQLNPSEKVFSYTDLNSGPFTALLSSTPSNSVFLSTFGTLLSPSVATVTLNATATATPTLAGSTVTQLFSGSLAFTLLAPQLGLNGPSTNALTVSFTNAVFEAVNGTEAPTLSADDHLGASIQYVSDFADLSGMFNKNFSLSFSSASSPMTLSAGRLPTVRMSGAGTFAGAVPEPATWGMMLVGFGTVGFAMRTTRRKRIAFA